MRELFRPILVETMTQLPTRPLGKFSDFVVLGLPASLTAIREGIAIPSVFHELSDGLIEGLSSDIITRATSTPKSADLALLDMLVMDNALVRTSLPNSKLSALIETLAAANGRPPIITYEDLILINPLDMDCRLHTDGKVGSSERGFYVAHREIEEDLDILINTSKESIARLEREGLSSITEVSEMIHTAGLRWVNINERMDFLWNEVPKDHFTAFREYFMSHPSRKNPDGEVYKGPSGAFTAGIPVFEILFAGEKMKPEQFNYFKENEIYFPRKGREDIRDALEYLQNGLTLTQLAGALGNPPTLGAELAKLDYYLNQFRGKHYGAVKHHIPGAIEGNVSGSTGQTEVGQFLKGRMIRHVD